MSAVQLGVLAHRLDAKINIARDLITAQFALRTFAKLICGASDAEIISLHAYGMNLGIAFQIIDDILDYTEDQSTIGKPAGNDLRQGMVTLPLIYALQRGDARQRELIKSAIQNGGIEHLSEITHAVASLGGLAYTARLAQSEADQALAALTALPATPYRDGLRELAEFAVARKH